VFFLFKKYIEDKKLYLILLFLFASDIQAKTINVSAGDFVALGKTDITLTNEGTSCKTSSLCYNGYMPDILRFYTGSPPAPENCSDAARIENIDGYSGIRLSWGGVLVIYSGSIYGDSFLNGSGGTGPVSLGWSDKGQVTRGGIAKAYQSSACWYSLEYPFTDDRGERGVSTVSGSINVGLYIPKNIASGSYTIPQYRAGRYWSKTILLAGSDDTVIISKASLECTASAPPTINFGTVNLNGVSNNGLLASKSQGIDISCSSNSEGAVAENMEISFVGDYSSSYWGRLSVKNSSGVSMGYIRGRYLDAEGSCAADSQNEVGFDSTNGRKTINNVGVGTTHIPITWSLCSNGSGLLGDGSAQATVNINWD